MINLTTNRTKIKTQKGISPSENKSLIVYLSVVYLEQYRQRRN